MDGNVRLIVLEGEQGRGDERLGSRMARSRALNAIAAMGGKVRHDSGGRLIVVEVPEHAEADLGRVAGARLLPVDADVRRTLPDLDPTERLFADALALRASRPYREFKRTRKYGESPEEQALMTAGCVREGV